MTTIKNLATVVAGLYAEKCAAEAITVELYAELEALKAAPCPEDHAADLAQAVETGTKHAKEVERLGLQLAENARQQAKLHELINQMGGAAEVCHTLADASPIELTQDDSTWLYHLLGGSAHSVTLRRTPVGRQETAQLYDRIRELESQRHADADAAARQHGRILEMEGQLREASTCIDNRHDQIAELQNQLTQEQDKVQKAIRCLQYAITSYPSAGAYLQGVFQELQK